MKKYVMAALLFVVACGVDVHVLHPTREPSAWNGLVLLANIAVVYFLPSLVAWVRGHHAVLAVFLTNLFLGWTFLGWVAALVWSVMPVKTNVTA